MAVYTKEAQKMLLRAAELCEQVNGATPAEGTALYRAVASALTEALSLAVQASGELEVERRILTSGTPS